MKKLTKPDIEKFANEIMAYLEKYGLDSDVCIYYNNKRMQNKYDWKNPDAPHERIVEDNMSPCDYFEYVNRDHILSMSFEGPLYDSLNYSGYKEPGLRKIFEKYGVYWELGNAWNLSAYPIDDNMEVEFTSYEPPKERIRLYLSSEDDYPSELRNIMEVWYLLSKGVGDIGSCVIGAGFEFTWNGEDYFMSACSPYQGSISWEAHKDRVKKLLASIGATSINYHWGNMD